MEKRNVIKGIAATLAAMMLSGVGAVKSQCFS